MAGWSLSAYRSFYRYDDNIVLFTQCFAVWAMLTFNLFFWCETVCLDPNSGVCVCGSGWLGIYYCRMRLPGTCNNSPASAFLALCSSHAL